MIEKFVDYFANRHLLTNLIFFVVIVGGVASWQSIKKEEMPDVTFDQVRISASYPGATAEEVEHFVTKELEKAVKGIDGVHRVTSSASQGNTSVTVELQQHFPRKDEAITEIRSAVLGAELPTEIRDDPTVRVFETSKKAIIDVTLIYTDTHLMDIEARQLLQQYAISLENQLLNLPQVNSVNRSGYFQEEIQVNVDPSKLIEYKIPLSQVMTEVRDNHLRQPAGNLEAQNEPKVTLNAQLDTPEKLNAIFIQAGFEGRAISLQEIAQVRRGFDFEKEITKVNGHEGIMLNIVKNSGYGILDSISAVKRMAESFQTHHLKDVPIALVLLDDESFDVRNRLSIIATNGALGFVLILLALFLFLNKRSGFWVAMGIPFSVCLTLIGSLALGYTINNTTLAAVIIVMGIVVDDAIVVAENIGRMRRQGLSSRDAAMKGTSQVFLPVLASIVTTCIAFVPLFFFSGRFGKLNSFLPPIIFLMLGASLFESLVILPGHMHFGLPRLKKYFKNKDSAPQTLRQHWFDKIENAYGRLLMKILPRKHFVFLVFIVMLVLCGLIMKYQMKFVMFPNEETRDIVLSGDAAPEADRYETAELTLQVEEIFKPFIGKEVIGLRTEVARSRRGGAVEENRFRTIVEIVSRGDRKRSADQLIALWKPEIDKIEGLEKIVIQKSRWGQSSGSPIEIIVQENDDALREQASNKLAALMKAHPALTNVEIERPIKVPEYKIDLQREKVKRLSIDPTDISATFRASLEGTVLYELPKGEEEVDVRLSVLNEAKTDIHKILAIPVENRNNYLVPLGDVVEVEVTETPNSISRRDYKRTTTVYADINPKRRMTPLEIASDLEGNAFPQVLGAQPSTTLSFIGEVYDTRESQGDFRRAIIMVVVLIFVILAVLFNSFSRPLLIMLAIPFGLVGVIFTFFLHGKLLFGFFAAIGVLGLAGVVINDSIIMLAKLDNEFNARDRSEVNGRITAIVQTRLKAVVLTTVTTVAGVLPTAYGFFGYDAMLGDMMLALAWGLVFGTTITLLLVPCLYSLIQDVRFKLKAVLGSEVN
jgi:multidrug efflux pump subunit AcrB